MKLRGVVRRGLPAWDDEAAVRIACREIGEGQRFECDIERPKTRRSTNANARYWKVLVGLTRHTINEQRQRENLPPLPDSEEVRLEIHAALVRKFVGVEDSPIGPIRKRTKTMTTREFWMFTEHVALWLREQGWEVPDEAEPQEVA